MANKIMVANKSHKISKKNSSQKVTKSSTEANKGQISEELSDKDSNAEAGESPWCWKSLPPKCIINIAEILDQTKSYDHLVTHAKDCIDASKQDLILTTEYEGRRRTPL